MTHISITYQVSAERDPETDVGQTNSKSKELQSFPKWHAHSECHAQRSRRKNQAEAADAAQGRSSLVVDTMDLRPKQPRIQERPSFAPDLIHLSKHEVC